MAEALVDIRLRSHVSTEEMDAKVGKILTSEDYNILLTGPAYVRKPNGKPLCVYLPGVMAEAATPEVYEILHSLRNVTTRNRGTASGAPRAQYTGSARTEGLSVPSALVGAVDPSGVYKYCRLTVWTGENLPQWQRLQPFLQEIARHLKRYVPDRFERQLEEARKAKPEWVVPGTPFSTVTVNNTYPTGVHTDKGDLEEGFSTIACIRRGEYAGGTLCFPEFRVGVNMQDGDLLLMDAHEWHGNTAIVCACGEKRSRCCEKCGAERISTVAYFRTKVAECGTVEQELQRAAKVRERR